MIALVTGASGGIGRSVVSKLLVRNFIVYAWVKNKIGEEQLLDYLARINVRVNNLYIFSADFCDSVQVSGAIIEVKTMLKKRKISLFINCAGCFMPHTRKAQTDANFIVNCFMPINLFNQFSSLMSSDARAIFLLPNFKSNLAHFQISNLSATKKSYLISKLMLYYKLRQAAKMGKQTNIYFYSAHPTTTDFYIKNVSGFMHYLGIIRKAFSYPPEFAAEQVVTLATRPEFSNESGGLYYNLKLVPPPTRTYSKRFLHKTTAYKSV
mgnify:CR=1 FL=1